MPGPHRIFEIDGREVGTGKRPYFIADIGSNHDGDLDRALELIDLAAQAGVDAVKFQHFHAENIVSRRGFEAVGAIGHQAGWGDVYDTYRDAQVPLHWTERLAGRCEDDGVAFMTTPYDLELVDTLNPYVPAWKIGSGDITWYDMIRKVCSKGKPFFLATGASTQPEVAKAIDVAREGDAPFVLMHCNTNYTGEVDYPSLNLGVLDDWRCYGIPLGLSDHVPGARGMQVVCSAVALGACAIEKHFTDDPGRPGPDHHFAMDPLEWSVMIEDANRVWESLGTGQKKVEYNEEETRIIQRRALRWSIDLPAGRCVRETDLRATRPCPRDGLPPYEAQDIIGRYLRFPVQGDELVRLEVLR